MAKPNYPQQHQQRPHRPTGRTNMASCMVATIFLIFIIIIALILYFTLFKPTDPTITITAIQLPSFSLSNNKLINFTLSQYAKVKNPNRASFSHYDSSLQLFYAGNQVGFMFIPAGSIEAGRTQYMAATFTVQSFPLVADAPAAMPTIQIESRMEMVGKVRVLRVFTHHVKAKAGCMVVISLTDGSVLAFHC